MATLKKKGGATSSPQLFFVRRQQPGDATFLSDHGDVFGDAGLIFNMINGPHTEQCIRLGLVAKFTGKIADTSQCQGCGERFMSMNQRDGHYKRRHAPKGANVVNLEDLSEEQRQIMKARLQGLTQEDEEYWTGPGDLHVPDPTDKETEADMVRADHEAPINWDKTAASRR